MKIKLQQSIWIYLIVFFIWGLSIGLKIRFNGLVFGLDYGLYHPDGALYSTRAFDWSGFSESQSAKIVSDWYNIHAFKFNFTIPNDLYYANHHLYPEYSTRILYPLLSVPFIKLMGMQGMLVVPALSLLLLMLIVAKIGLTLQKPLSTLVVVFLLSSSTTVLRWMLSNTTDALLTGIFALIAFVLFKKLSAVSWYVYIGILIVLSGVTRFSLLFWLGIGLVLFLNNSKTKGIYTALLSIVVVLPTILSHSGNSFLAVEGNRPFLERLFLYPFYLIKVTVYEFAQLFVFDKILFFMCIFSVYFSVRTFEKISSKYLLIMFATGLLMGALNGNVGVNFRYQLPVLVFVCWSLLDNASPRIEKLIKLNKPN
jgi:hypothetical protein